MTAGWGSGFEPGPVGTDSDTGPQGNDPPLCARL